MRVEVSNGELLDKWTILTIKRERITEAVALKNVQKEHTVLSEAMRLLNIHNLPAVEKLVEELLDVNFSLWDVEDILREMERDEEFDQGFIDQARTVYALNDRRAEIKREINEMTNSLLTEEKLHPTYKEV